MKVLLNDGLENEGLKALQDAGVETDTQKRDGERLVADIGGFDALIVRSATKVTREVIEAGARENSKSSGAQASATTTSMSPPRQSTESSSNPRLTEAPTPSPN